MMKSVLLLLFSLLLIQGFASNEIYISSNGSSEASCGSIHSPCLSLSNIAQWENDTVVIIEGSIVLDRVIEIHSIHNLTLTSSSASSNRKEMAAAINCVCPSYDCGLIIADCKDVTFNELSVSGCSMQHVIGVLKRHFYRSGITIDTTTNIQLSIVSISNNIGTGLLLINAAGNITIEESVFSNNSIPYPLQRNGSNDNIVHGGSGLVILISACEVTAKSCKYNTSTSGDYSILGTLFNNNTVNLTDLSGRDWLPSYGGGLGIFLVWNVQENTFNIEESKFTGNKASEGGGMIWHCEHFCQSNIVTLKRCLFSNNLFSHDDFGGAGMSIGFAHHTRYNSADNNVTVNGTTFFNNTGYYASGVLIYCNAMNPAVKSIKYNYVHFINSTWESNTGTAIEIEPNYKSQYFTEFTTKAFFEDCIFANNTIMNQCNHTMTSSYSFSKGIGAFVITKLTVHFRGYNTFNNNKGTALYIFSGSAHFETGAVTVFNNNTGTYGGAIGLVGYSNIQYNNDTRFEFISNSASVVGGAIYVIAIRPHISLSSHLCFLQHLQKHPNTKFIFKDNWSHTGIANSIYITSTKPCQIACSDQSNKLFINQSCFGVFNFTNYSNVVASGGSAFSVSQPTPLSIIPGRKYSLPITLYDDMGQNITKIATFQPTLSNEGNISVSTGFEFVSNKEIKITGKPGEGDNLALRLIGFQNIKVSVRIKLASCPPGYVIDDDSSSCVCSASNNDNSLTYVGIYRCDESKEVALALKGYWVGYVLPNKSATPNPSNLYTSDCPLGFCHNCNKSHYSLTESASKDDLEKVVCAENRIGTLCSQCKKGYSVHFHSSTNKCGENHNCSIGFVFYFLSELLPITGLFFTIVYFDISLTTGLAYNFLFIVQLLQTVVESVNIGVDIKCIEIIRSVYTVLYNMLNLDFFDIDKLSFCLWNGAGTLDVISIKYASVIYAVLLIIGLVYAFKYCCCSKCKCSTKNYSVVQGLTAFLVLSYFKCAFITFKLLDHRIISGIGQRNYLYVVSWDGSLEYFSTQHLWYAIPALICLFLFIIPFPLILTFDGLSLKVESKLAIRFAFIRRLMPWTAIHYKLKPLLDSFQGPFKDQYRFFAGLYFFYRLLLLSLFVMASTEFQYYFFLAIALTLIIMMQATVQPFEEKKHNICAVLTFTNMALINLFTVCIFFLESSNGYATAAIIAQCIQVILIYIPLVAVALWLLRICYYKAKVNGHSRDNDNGGYEELLFDRSAVLPAVHENS